MNGATPTTSRRKPKCATCGGKMYLQQPDDDYGLIMRTVRCPACNPYDAPAPEPIVPRAPEPVVDTGPKVHPLACCSQATIARCVCRISFDCPVHGTKCHGSHE